MGHKNELVCGVGMNDAGYSVCNTVRVGGRSKNLWICPFYRAWTGMLERSYSAKFQARHPTYIGCTVDPTWHLFSTFKEWMSRQDHEGKHLDKDILVSGNKIYSAETCAFVSRAINTFIVDSRAIRGDWPIGVSWNKGDRGLSLNVVTHSRGSINSLATLSVPIWLTRRGELTSIKSH